MDRRRLDTDGSTLFTIMAALAQMGHDIKCERITDRRIRSALQLIQSSETTAQ